AMTLAAVGWMMRNDAARDSPTKSAYSTTFCERCPSGAGGLAWLTLRYPLTDPLPIRYPAKRPWLEGERMRFDHLKRREFITLVAGAVLAPRRAQRPAFGVDAQRPAATILQN